jgi:hypothetical protein
VASAPLPRTEKLIQFTLPEISLPTINAAHSTFTAASVHLPLAQTHWRDLRSSRKSFKEYQLSDSTNLVEEKLVALIDIVKW